MTRDTRIALFLIGELVAALRANDPDAFRGLLSEGMQELGVTEVEELLLDWLNSFLNVDERDNKIDLYFDENSEDRGLGDGGIFAILKGKSEALPTLVSSDFVII